MTASNERVFLAPDVLVLGGGGVLGEAWMNGALAGIEDGAGIDLREVDVLVGTSAGSIVAANLAAGRSPRRPQRRDADAGQPAQAGVGAPRRLLMRGAAPLRGRVIPYEAPAGALLRATVLRGLPRGTRTLERLERSLERAQIEFDGRLRVVCVELRTGRRVVFGAPAAPTAPVSRAVVASCSIPGYFEPVEIGGREYVDGGVHSPVNLDAAPAGHGTKVLCLAPLAGLQLALASPLRLLRARLGAELVGFERRGARVSLIAPWSAAAAPMARDLMDDAQRAFVHAAGYAQGLQMS
ncbi:MAG: patatin-like phospholipase family protein [Solirubrobacteraceae bacterium]